MRGETQSHQSPADLAIALSAKGQIALGGIASNGGENPVKLMFLTQSKARQLQ